MELADWLTSANNPLPARVYVNRVWQHLFGDGLVKTVDNFGTTGETPSNPELLDHLAKRFVQQGWSTKALIKSLVLSRAYQLSSDAVAANVQVDPANRLLARQSRLRLEAEIVRDISLAVSGLLNPSVGGPSVFPPQPDGVMTLGQSRREWTTSSGADRYRRVPPP